MDNSILDNIIKELKRAKKKFPHWPDHIAARAGIVCEEAGELMQASLEFKYEKGKKGRNREQQIKQMEIEAIQTAATCIRFIECLKSLRTAETIQEEEFVEQENLLMQ